MQNNSPWPPGTLECGFIWVADIYTRNEIKVQNDIIFVRKDFKFSEYLFYRHTDMLILRLFL